MTTLGFKDYIYVRVSVGIGASRYGANHTITIDCLLPVLLRTYKRQYVACNCHAISVP